MPVFPAEIVPLLLIPLANSETRLVKMPLFAAEIVPPLLMAPAKVETALT